MSKEKKEYEIAVEWSECGTVKIMADSLEEAIKMAEDSNPTSTTDGGYYIDGSWSVNVEMSQDLNLEASDEGEGASDD